MKKDFYMVLSQLLIELNVSQSKLAKELGISQGTISKWLSGVQEPSYKYLQKICEVLNIDGNEILGLD